MAELRQEQLSEILQRAHEIEAQTGQILPEHEHLLQAADEIGLQRDAVLQALRERLSVPVEQFEEGSKVFAKSADGNFYVAELHKIDAEHAKVRFLKAGEAPVSAKDLRLFSLTPGMKIEYFSNGMKMWCGASIASYDAAKQKVTVNSWGSEEKVNVDQIRLPRERTQTEMAVRAKLWVYSLASLAAGTGIGIAIMNLLGR